MYKSERNSAPTWFDCDAIKHQVPKMRLGKSCFFPFIIALALRNTARWNRYVKQFDSVLCGYLHPKVIKKFSWSIMGYKFNSSKAVYWGKYSQTIYRVAISPRFANRSTDMYTFYQSLKNPRIPSSQTHRFSKTNEKTGFLLVFFSFIFSFPRFFCPPLKRRLIDW